MYRTRRVSFYFLNFGRKFDKSSKKIENSSKQSLNEIALRDGEIQKLKSRTEEHEVRIGHLNLEK